MAQEKDPKAFYGYLFEQDKRPTPVMNSLLKGIGTYIAKHIGDPNTTKLTPTKLAAFYKAVGGNYDPFFLELSHSRISFIFTSIGCQHTLQPIPNDDFKPPSIPALTLKGFVHWQSIELLLSPEEHVGFLQRCVKDFCITNPDTGERFPSELPKEALPQQPDDAILAWHKSCSEKLLENCTPHPTPTPGTAPGSGPGTQAGTPQSPRPRSSTEPNKFGDGGVKYGYGYAHVKPPVHSFSATSSPRMRPAELRRDREDYFNSRPLPRRQKTGLNPNSAANSRPGTSERLNPEEYEDFFNRGRRKSVPKNYYSNPENITSPGSGRSTSHPPHSPRDERIPGIDPFGSASSYARRHSHPRHKKDTPFSSDGESEASDDGVSEPPSSPEFRPKRSKAGLVREREGFSRSNSGRVIPEVRYSAASPGTSSPRLRPVGSGGIIGGVTGVASRISEKLHRNLSVPSKSSPTVRYRVVDLDGAPVESPRERERLERSAAERAERKLRHVNSTETRHSTDTSGGSRSNSRLDRERGERGNVRWHDLTDGVPSARRHSDSPPHLGLPSREREERERGSFERERGERDRDWDRERRREGEKFRREEFGVGRSSEEERKRSRKEKIRAEELYVRERDRERDRERERERERAARLSDRDRERRGTFFKAGVESRR